VPPRWDWSVIVVALKRHPPYGFENGGMEKGCISKTEIEMQPFSSFYSSANKQRM